MPRQPRLAMTPWMLPQQRLSLVTDLPELPSDWASMVVRSSTADMPKRLPYGSRYLGQLEWAWSPVNSRISSYYVSMSSGQQHWVLWLKYFDDNWGRWCSPEPIRAAHRCGGLKALEAAQWLLYDHWLSEREAGLDSFHWIAEEGDLDVSVLRAVSRAVWGDEE